ncbi:MAG: XVIPCD domain-containing protein [Stenotrophomonas sp.]
MDQIVTSNATGTRAEGETLFLVQGRSGDPAALRIPVPTAALAEMSVETSLQRLQEQSGQNSMPAQTVSTQQQEVPTIGGLIMYTASSFRLAFLAALLLSSAACASAPPAPTPSDAPAASGTPSLPGLSNPSYHVPVNTRSQPLPSDIADLLLSLSSSDLGLPGGTLQVAVSRAKASIMEVPRIAGRPDRLISALAPRDSALWVRTFESENPDITGYLVQVDIDCRMLQDLPKDASLEAAQAQCSTKARRGFGGQLRAYLKTGNHPAEDITHTITPPEQLLGAEVMNRYLKATASEPFPDGTRLNRVPVIRWVVEADPDDPLAKDENTFAWGNKAHVGFLLWNGDHFETRATVPAALWPCPMDASHEDSLLCPKDDRFVIIP